MAIRLAVDRKPKLATLAHYFWTMCESQGEWVFNPNLDTLARYPMALFRAMTRWIYGLGLFPYVNRGTISESVNHELPPLDRKLAVLYSSVENDCGLSRRHVRVRALKQPSLSTLSCWFITHWAPTQCVEKSDMYVVSYSRNCGVRLRSPWQVVTNFERARVSGMEYIVHNPSTLLWW